MVQKLSKAFLGAMVGVLSLISVCSVFSAHAAVFVISDIDDTIKMSNSMGKWYRSMFHFLRQKPYYEMRDLFNEIATDAANNNEPSHFYYVTAAPRLVSNAEKFLRKYSFPIGPVTMRPLVGESTYDYKYRVIKNILSQASPFQDRVYFFGDNSSQDAVVYRDLMREFGLKNAAIFIRDVRTDATHWGRDYQIQRLENVNYFLSETELIDHSNLSFLSDTLKNKILDRHRRRALIPSYTFTTFNQWVSRLFTCHIFGRSDSERCDKDKRNKAKQDWEKYQNWVEETVVNRRRLMAKMTEEDHGV